MSFVRLDGIQAKVEICRIWLELGVDLDKEGILFLLGYYCLKLTSFIRNLVYCLISNSFWNRSDSPFVCRKEV